MSQGVSDTTPTVSTHSLSVSGLTAVQFQRLAEAGIISAHPNVVHGEVVFAGTRVPLYNLWDYLNGGDSIDDFLESFPTVRGKQIQQALELVKGSMTNGRLPAREYSL